MVTFNSDMVVYVCNLRTQETEAEGLRDLGQPGLLSEFQDSLGNITRPFLKNKQQQ
jgi:hypothetical protein